MDLDYYLDGWNVKKTFRDDRPYEAYCRALARRYCLLSPRRPVLRGTGRVYGSNRLWAVYERQHNEWT